MVVATTLYLALVKDQAMGNCYVKLQLTRFVLRKLMYVIVKVWS